jgi:prolyl 4-hydroxylase
MPALATPTSQIVIPGIDGKRFCQGDSLDHRSPLAWTVDGIMSPAECSAFCKRMDDLGCVPAPITTSRGFVMRPDIRNNTRVIIDDASLAETLYRRIAAHVPPGLGDMRPVGANERLRCYRYDPGQRFAPHYDGAFHRSEDEESLLTFMIYLNEDFEGGGTHFHHYESTVIPKTGTALLFQHRLLHEGCLVHAGVKYVLRSDVMYGR